MDLEPLSGAERTLLSRLTAFRAGATLDAIDEILRTSWDHLDDPFDTLHTLRDRALVLVEEPPRYRLPEAVREAILRPMDSQTLDLAMNGLFSWTEGFCARVAEGATGVDQEAWFDRAGLELANVCDAIEYGNARAKTQPRSLRMAIDLRHFWAVRGHYRLGRSLIEPVLDGDSAVPDALRASATNLVGVLALSMGDLDAAERRLSESLALARLTGDAMAQGRVLGNLGMIAWERTDFPSAHAAFDEAAEIFRQAEEWGSLGVALLNLGSVRIDMERLGEAKDALEASLDPLRRAGDHSGLAFSVGNLGYLALIRNDREEALAHVRASLDSFGRLGEWKGTMNTLISAATLLANGDRESAATVRGAIEAMSLTEGMASTPRDDQRLAAIDRAIGEAPEGSSLSEHRLKGLAMSPRHAIEYALSALSAHASGAPEKTLGRI